MSIVKLMHFRYLLAENAFLRIVLYEQKTSLGGTWNFTPLPSNGHKYGAGNLNQGSTGNARDVVTANITKFNTPMYEGLESNLPHMLMQFSDAPFPSGTQLFAKRETVQDYLEDYAKEIVSMIRFSHQVVEIKPTNGDEPHEWEVTTKDVGTGVDNMERFDAVIVANGHSAQPLLPNIKGLDHWSRQSPESIYHSVSYKNNEAFENKVSKHVSFPLIYSLIRSSSTYLGIWLMKTACPSCRRWPLRCRHQPSNCRSLQTSSPRGTDREIPLLCGRTRYTRSPSSRRTNA